MGGMLLTMLFMFYIILNPDLRTGMGDLAAGILEPEIGFDHRYPILTFLFAGLLMITLTTFIRHILIDWEKVAEIQTKTSQYNNISIWVAGLFGSSHFSEDAFFESTNKECE